MRNRIRGFLIAPSRKRSGMGISMERCDKTDKNRDTKRLNRGVPTVNTGKSQIIRACLKIALIFGVVAAASGCGSNEQAAKTKNGGQQEEQRTGEPQEGEPETGKSQEEAPETEITEGGRVCIANQTAFWGMGGTLYSASVGSDGSLYDVVEEASFSEDIVSAAYDGTDIILATEKGIYTLDLESYKKNKTGMTLIEDYGDVESFYLYEGKVYFEYASKVNKISPESGTKTELADNVNDFQMTGQGIYYINKDGGLFLMDMDGENKKKLADTPKNAYLSAGAHNLYYWSENKGEVGCYHCDTNNMEILPASQWDGEYPGIYAMWETSEGLLFPGADNKIYCCDPDTGEERVSENFNKKINGVSFSFPFKGDGVMINDVVYKISDTSIYWNGIKAGVAGVYSIDGDKKVASGDSNTNDATGKPKGGSGTNNAADTLKTDFYSLQIPKTWDGKVVYKTVNGQYNDYSLQFYHKASQAAGMEGFLFSIEMYMDGDDYTYEPSYEEIGRLIYKPAEPYDIVVLYPTDVQYPDSAAKEYQTFRKQIPDVIASFQVNSMYGFKKYHK